jgi:hypothetical protein
MPNTILAQVTQRTQSRGLTFALLKEIAFRHHPKFGYAFPRLQTLAAAIRVSVRTVQRHIGFVKLLTLLPTPCHTHCGDAPFMTDGTPA